MDSNSITSLSGSELARLIATKTVSPVELVKAYLERIGRYDDQLNAYITVCKDDAIAAAIKAEEMVMKGDELGSLHGLPMGVKDQFETEGVLTTAGSTILANYVPKRDATTIKKVKEQGVIILGKLNMTEFAAGMGDPFKYGDPPRNPWNPERTPASSSTGPGIAIAASLCAVALGEDTGGSIRAPASANGIVGLRPTWGRVSRYGLLPIAWSMDAAGPMTRTVEDAALIMNAIAGYDANDPQTSKIPVGDYTKDLGTELKGIRIGIIQELMNLDNTNGEVHKALKDAAVHLESLGATVEEVRFNFLTDMGAAASSVAIVEGVDFHRQWLVDRPQDYGRNLRTRLLSSGLIPSQLALKAMRIRALFRREWLRLFEKYDILLSPTSSSTAGKINYEEPLTSREEAERRSGIADSTGKARRGLNSTLPAALAGTPAMSIPCGFDKDGMPIGMQIMASHFREDLIFKVGHAYEQTTNWHTMHPSLSWHPLDSSS